MKILAQLTLLATLGVLGIMLAQLLPFPFPGSIMSMLLLLLLMIFQIIKLHHIKRASEFFLHYMGAFFVVPSVAIMENIGLLQGQVVPFLLVCMLSALLTFAATALAVKITISLLRNKEGQS